MAKQVWKAGNMVYPLPVVMVSCVEGDGTPNIITVAWTGTICTNPAMVYISVRPERYSYDMIKNSGQFVINLTTEAIAKQTDYCGVRSGRNVNKFEEMKLTPEKASQVKAPLIKESPVNIECELVKIVPLGSHDMFIANVLAVNVDEAYMNEKGKFELAKANPIVYSHGEYYGLGDLIGTFGYSVRKVVESNNIKEDKKVFETRMPLKKDRTCFAQKNNNSKKNKKRRNKKRS